MKITNMTEHADLARLGLAVGKNGKMIQSIKSALIKMINDPDELLKVNYSDYISEKLKYDYTYLSNVFSMATGSTIQHFIITLKVGRIKEMMLDDKINLTEISYRLHYSSVAHLSNQFKKIVGLSPSAFKRTMKRLKS